MRKVTRESTDRQPFETVSLHLASAVLVQVPNAAFIRVSSAPSIDGKRLIVLDYPTDQAATVQRVVEQFHSRQLVVALYPYNRALNALRDRLLSGPRADYAHATAGHALSR